MAQITAADARSGEGARRHRRAGDADGGIKYSGDIVKRCCGRALGDARRTVRRLRREPGETVLLEGRQYKVYRGMGSLGAMASARSSRERYLRKRPTSSGFRAPRKAACRVHIRLPRPCSSCSAACARHGLLRRAHDRGAAHERALRASVAPACAAIRTTSRSRRKRRLRSALTATRGSFGPRVQFHPFSSCVPKRVFATLRSRPHPPARSVTGPSFPREEETMRPIGTRRGNPSCAA